MTLEEQINNDIKGAMRAKDASRLNALRAIKSAILLAKTDPKATDSVDEFGILQKLIKQRRDALEIYQQQNREDLASDEKYQMEVISEYLPEQMGEEELRKALTGLIAESGGAGMKDLGRIMGIAIKRLVGKADNKRISSILRSLLEEK
jgi:uncharacterized protein